MARRPFDTLGRRRLEARAAVVTALLLSVPSIQAQTVLPEIHHVRWPLLDMVLVPDSAGLWLLAAPTPSTMQWESGSHMVDFWIDPVVALQWVTVARQFASAFGPAHSDRGPRMTPRLRDSAGPDFIVLARGPGKVTGEKAFIFAASDSAREVKWRTYASLAEVQSMLNTLEWAAAESQAGTKGYLGQSPDPDPDEPVHIRSQPTPTYPQRLASERRIGRVWMSYVVGTDGRPVPGSFRPLLSDDSLFTQSAIRALLRSRFKPARHEGRPVAQRVFQIILFRSQ